ncbi:hypothetical protein DXG01_006162 [Tephrocybe rancida]|nr:hypothetical protein DXG01_006162 [Tephrocybe rancida]
MSSPTKRDVRNSRSLPLPSSLSAANTFTTQAAAPSNTRLPASSSSPTSSHFPLQSLHSPPNLSSSTHAGGIQPSSLFFHPARPAQQPQYSPQPSLRNDDPSIGDNYPLAPLSSSTHPQEQKRHSLGQASFDEQELTTDTTEDPHTTQFASLTRSKVSREPLLPIGGPSHTRKPSVLSTSPTSPPTSPKKLTAGRVRTSLDRVFGLTFPNRLSLDSIRNRNDSPYDEERALTPTKPPHSPTPTDTPLRLFNNRAPPAPSSRSHSPAPSHSSSVSGRPSTPTPAPSFIATPPAPTSASRYRLSQTPLLKPGSSKPIRNHELHPSRNHFFLSGRLLTGGDTPFAFIGSLSLVFGLAGLWFSTTCVFWWHHSNGTKTIVIVGAYLAALVLSTMLTTATADPGILPRGLDPDPPYPATSPSDGGVRAPMPRDLKVRSDVVRVKYCPTCKTYRPPRSSHCKMATTLLLIIITSALHLWLLTTIPDASGHTLNFRHALNDRKAIGSAVTFCLSVAVIWPVGALFSYHARLLLLNVTTIEMIRNQAHKTVTVPGAAKPPNPFSHGTRRRNLAAILCRPRGYSWLQAHAPATQDMREVNPGMRGVAQMGGPGRS